MSGISQPTALEDHNSLTRNGFPPLYPKVMKGTDNLASLDPSLAGYPEGVSPWTSEGLSEAVI